MSKKLSTSRLRFIPYLWVPLWGDVSRVYDLLDIERHRTSRGRLDYKEALKSKNASIASIAQRASVLMSALSLLLGAHIVLWVNVYMGSPRTVVGGAVVFSAILLVVSLSVLMSTLWFHWSSDLGDYLNDQAEYNRTLKLVKTRAYRVNVALVLAFSALFVSLLFVFYDVCTIFFS